jgi:hypothetical protein
VTPRTAWCDNCRAETPLQWCQMCARWSMCGNCERCDSVPCNDDWGDDDRDYDDEDY